MATTRIQTRRLDRSVARLDGKIVLRVPEPKN